ncbi:hypothetical protein CDAR_286211 [Caerostris darwini]|uniref:Uncharacterized protein n=1 Tax=Caerostris darwini TaxID=1538125 RepID=A0AAV4N4P5_9ARAC|nr:hypothetical protein CDAR_286211 [Caerostris darwini]
MADESLSRGYFSYNSAPVIEDAIGNGGGHSGRSKKKQDIVDMSPNKTTTKQRKCMFGQRSKETGVLARHGKKKKKTDDNTEGKQTWMASNSIFLAVPCVVHVIRGDVLKR